MPTKKVYRRLRNILFLDFGNSGIETLKLVLFVGIVAFPFAIVRWIAHFVIYPNTLFQSDDYDWKVNGYLYVAKSIFFVLTVAVNWIAIKRTSRITIGLLIVVLIIPIPINIYVILFNIRHPPDSVLSFVTNIIMKSVLEVMRLQAILVVLICYKKLGSPVMSMLKEHSEFLRKQEHQSSKKGNGTKTEKEEVGHKEFSKFVISPLELTIESSTILGEGEFGRVCKGTLTKKCVTFVQKDKVAVAVKVVNNPEDPLRFKMLLEEIKTMIRAGDHENIIHFFGVTSDAGIEGHLAIITEFCELSSLDKFLTKTRHTFVNLVRLKFNSECNMQELEIETESPLEYVNLEEHGTHTTLDLIRIAYEIANGMEYLSSKKVIHGDLAARNILLGSERRVKVADFGLAHRLYNYQIYSKIESQQSFLPWRWMAVEAIEDLKFSEESDVWSFGVVLWEIFTLGEMPFKEIQWSQNFPKLLRNGLKLPKPRFGSYEMYNLMKQCWALELSNRPKFGEIKSIASSILNQYNSKNS